MSAARRPTVPVTERALIQRTKPEASRDYVGAKHCEPEKIGREIGVLASSPIFIRPC
jgi:hypothetical protein